MRIRTVSLCFTNQTCGQNIFQSMYRLLPLRAGVMVLCCQDMLQKGGQVMGKITQFVCCGGPCAFHALPILSYGDKYHIFVYIYIVISKCICRY
jgi:hypothetical protein